MKTQYQNKAIHKVFDILQYLSADEETRRLAEIREDALRNEASMLAAAQRVGQERGERIGQERGERIGQERGERIGQERGEKIGQEKGEMLKAIKTAESLLSMNILTAEQVSASTELSLDKVLELKDAGKAGDKA